MIKQIIFLVWDNLFLLIGGVLCALAIFFLFDGFYGLYPNLLGKFVWKVETFQEKIQG